MNRVVYHVTPSQNGWRAERQGSNKAVCAGATKQEVVDCISEKAKQEERAQIKIHGRSGKIMEERIYGEDPKN